MIAKVCLWFDPEAAAISVDVAVLYHDFSTSDFVFQSQSSRFEMITSLCFYFTKKINDYFLG